jgi:hypothetical protein
MALGWVSKRGKMSHRDNMSQYGKRDIVKQIKMSQNGYFVIIQIKKGGCFVTATLHPPPRPGECKIPERFVRN